MSEHVRAGGSRIHRILACPGSLQAPETEAGPAAALGTAAHYVGERCLMTGCNADHPSFIGERVTVLGQKITRAVADAVQVYVDWARDVMARHPKHHLFLEHSVSWDKLGPPEPMRGSADCIIVVPSEQLMIVGDYKNGTDPVAVKGNKQTRYYAVGALLTLPREITQHVRRVQMTIIQPNAQPLPPEGAVCSETVDVGELLDFADEVLDAVRAGQAADAPRVPGKHCKYCGLAASCGARATHSVVEAQSEFEVITVGASRDLVATMPIAQLAQMALQAEDIIERAQAWLKDAKERIEAEIKTGDVPGWKMVPKRATRVWNDPKAVEAWATLDQGLDPASIRTAPELLSPAQMEDLVGKKNLPKHLYSSVSSGYNLARASSSKDAARIAASDEFETVKP